MTQIEQELDNYIKGNFTIVDEEYCKTHGIRPEDYMYTMDRGDMLAMIRHFRGFSGKQPQGLKEAADEYSSNWYRKRLGTSRKCDGCFWHVNEAFKAGAQWLAEQGVSVGGKVIMDFSDPDDILNRRLIAKLGEALLQIEPGDVVVQIRRKE